MHKRTTLRITRAARARAAGRAATRHATGTLSRVPRREARGRACRSPAGTRACVFSTPAALHPMERALQPGNRRAVRPKAYSNTAPPPHRAIQAVLGLGCGVEGWSS